jgi:hypothetical protein
MPKLSTVFDRACLAYIHAEVDSDATEVTGIDTSTREEGYCETCSYTTVVIEISYRSPNNTFSWPKIHTFEGDMGEFIRKLDEDDV